MFSNTSNTKQQGDVGVAFAIALYTSKGYIVSAPLTDKSLYDLLVDKDGKIFRVQVKTTKNLKKSGSYEVTLRTSGGNRSWSGVVKRVSADTSDLLFILTDSGAMFEIPSEIYSDRTTITLGESYTGFEVFFG